MTTIKTVIFAAALGLASLSFASIRSYNVVISHPTVVGNTTLGAGSYKLNIDGQIATFTNVENGKRQMVLVHKTDSDVNYEHTVLDLVQQNGVERMEAIELEDTNNKLEF